MLEKYDYESTFPKLCNVCNIGFKRNFTFTVCIYLPLQDCSLFYAEFMTLTEECEVTGLRKRIKECARGFKNREDMVDYLLYCVYQNLCILKIKV